MGIGNSALAAVTLNAWLVVCSAAALAPGKPSDDSVCDLSPGTTVLLGRETFISASHSADDQAVGYRRLAAEFVSRHCASQQTLVLHSQDSDRIDARYLPELAIDLCKAADVVRSETTSTARFTNEKVSGYELRCRITKLESFRKQLQDDEVAESTAGLIARLRSKPGTSDTPAIQDSRGDSHGQTRTQDCGKLTMAATTIGGEGCR